VVFLVLHLHTDWAKVTAALTVGVLGAALQGLRVDHRMGWHFKGPKREAGFSSVVRAVPPRESSRRPAPFSAVVVRRRDLPPPEDPVDGIVAEMWGRQRWLAGGFHQTQAALTRGAAHA